MNRGYAAGVWKSSPTARDPMNQPLAPHWPTLQLNSSFEPMRVIPWQRAVLLAFGGKVDVVETYGAAVHSPSVTLPVPAVVRLRRFVRWRERGPRFCRRNVLRRDGHACQYCGAGPDRAPLTLDHVLPRSQGGRTDWLNVVTACAPCNHRKGSRTPEQADMKLAGPPRRPNWLPASRTDLSPTAPPPEWALYLRAA